MHLLAHRRRFSQIEPCSCPTRNRWPTHRLIPDSLAMCLPPTAIVCGTHLLNRWLGTWLPPANSVQLLN